MKCPQCRFVNKADATECDSCGVVFKHLERARKAIPQSPDLCSWTDVGNHCQHRGVAKIDGSWYCREHWDRREGLDPKGRGNYPTTSTRSAHMHQWDDWYPEWLANRPKREPLPVPAFLRERLREREPGCDDELIPEEKAL